MAFISMFALNTYAQCEAQIKDFYVAYMQNLENNEEANVDLMKNHMCRNSSLKSLNTQLNMMPTR